MSHSCWLSACFCIESMLIFKFTKWLFIKYEMKNAFFVHLEYIFLMFSDLWPLFLPSGDRSIRRFHTSDKFRGVQWCVSYTFSLLSFSFSSLSLSLVFMSASLLSLALFSFPRSHTMKLFISADDCQVNSKSRVKTHHYPAAHHESPAPGFTVLPRWLYGELLHYAHHS